MESPIFLVYSGQSGAYAPNVISAALSVDH